MGYTTKFSGRFYINSILSPEKVNSAAEEAIRWLHETRHEDGPSLYCQWELSDDGRGIEWDEGEKFYEYMAWLEIVAQRLRIEGYTLHGQVLYRGENFKDVGVIVARGSKFEKKKWNPDAS